MTDLFGQPPGAPVKALTLHQPWASLMAWGVKTIETRGWATAYRGPLVQALLGTNRAFLYPQGAGPPPVRTSYINDLWYNAPRAANAAQAPFTSRCWASRYFSAVLATISAGRSGAGGFLSQPMRSR